MKLLNTINNKLSELYKNNGSLNNCIILLSADKYVEFNDEFNNSIPYRSNTGMAMEKQIKDIKKYICQYGEFLIICADCVFDEGFYILKELK